MPVVARTVLLLVASNVFIPFAVLYMRQSLRWNDLWAALCLCGAAWFAFRR